MTAEERPSDGGHESAGKPSGRGRPRRSPNPPRSSDRSTHAHRDERKRNGKRDGERKPHPTRDSQGKPNAKRDGERQPYAKRDADRKPYGKRDGERKASAKRDIDGASYGRRGGEGSPHAKRGGERTRYATRDGQPVSKGGRPLGGKPRSSRPPHTADRRVTGPEIPEDVTPRDLHPSARNELKTLSKENADEVARHLAMAARLLDEDPHRAHEHALAASRRAGRIAMVRETVAVTAYAIGDFSLALRELRTYRRISGKDDQIALLVDSERGVGRPDRALEAGRAVDRSSLPVATRVALAIAMSGARLDRGELELALGELEIPELDPNRAFEWSPALFAARAAVLEDLGRADEAAFWLERADVASAALGAASGSHDEIIVEEIVGDDVGVDENVADDVGVEGVLADAPHELDDDQGAGDGQVTEGSVD